MFDDAAAAPAGRPAPFKRKSDPQPTDMMSISVPRKLLDEVMAERDRVDAPLDSLGRTRKQMGKDKWGELLVRKGMQWARTLPAWTDPLALDDQS